MRGGRLGLAVRGTGLLRPPPGRGPATNTDHEAVAAPVRLALPSAATDPISRTVPYQHERCQPQYQAAEQHKASLNRMTATTVAPVSVRAKRRAATGNDHVGTENDPDLRCENFLHGY